MGKSKKKKINEAAAQNHDDDAVPFVISESPTATESVKMRRKHHKRKEAAQNPDDDAPLTKNASSDTHDEKKQSKKKRKNSEKSQSLPNDTVPSVKDTPTVSIALPGSIIDNAQSLELATRVTTNLLAIFSYCVAFCFVFMILNC